MISGWPRRCPSAVWCDASTRPATAAVHAAIVQLGFEGTVLKRPSSLYRPGRHGVWRKYKARHTARGCCWRSVRTVTGTGSASAMSMAAGWWRSPAPAPSVRSANPVNLVYSRVDADGDLREVRLAALADTKRSRISTRQFSQGGG